MAERSLSERLIAKLRLRRERLIQTPRAQPDSFRSKGRRSDRQIRRAQAARRRSQAGKSKPR